MRFRSPLGTKALSVLATWLIRAWIGSLRLERIVQPGADPLSPTCDANYLYVVWHESLLIPTYVYGPCRQYAIISQSRDGNLISQIAQRLGWSVVRGSSSRGAVAAVRQIVALARSAGNEQRTHLVITADGPRGPRRIMKDGAIYIAGKTGMLLSPVAVACDRPWLANSWDRFVLPRPFSRVCVILGKGIPVPSDPDEAETAATKEQLLAAMAALEDEAQARLQGRKAVAPPAITSSRAA